MTEWIWISRWEDFQHYKPDPSRGPKWIKDHTAQLDDDRYLSLTESQRALLHDLRLMFASMRYRVPLDTSSISARRNHRTVRASLEALNYAGLVEFISRATLEDRLEQLYSRSRSRNREKDLGAVRSKTTDEQPPLEAENPNGDHPPVRDLVNELAAHFTPPF